MNTPILDEQDRNDAAIGRLSDEQLVSFLCENHAFARDIEGAVLVELKKRGRKPEEIEEQKEQYLFLTNPIADWPPLFNLKHFFLSLFLLPFVFISFLVAAPGLLVSGIAIYAKRKRWQYGCKAEAAVWRRFYRWLMCVLILFFVLVLLFREHLG